MEEQTDIQNRQSKLMEAQHKPLLSCSVEGVEGDDIIFEATNDGEGIAQKIVLDLEVFVSKTNIGQGGAYSLDRTKMNRISEVTDNSPIEDENPMEEYGTDKFDIIYSASVGRTRYDSSGSISNDSPPVVGPHDSEKLRANLRLFFDGGMLPEITPDLSSDFSTTTEELASHDHTAIGYKIRYSYQNILTDTVEEDNILTSGVAILSPGQDFEDIFQNSVGRIGTLEPVLMRTEKEYVAMVKRY
jgi:hypothetical protein